jgi:hypothetical protein
MMQAFNGDMLSNRGEYRGLKIISNENGGRYIYEKELLSPGECILQVNRPRFAIPDWKGNPKALGLLLKTEDVRLDCNLQSSTIIYGLC